MRWFGGKQRRLVTVIGGQWWWRRRFGVLGEGLREEDGGKMVVLRCWTYLYPTRLTRAKVAIKKINDVFEHVSDATRILREIKLLRLLQHPDIVEIKHIMLPPSRREFRDVYVVFELMESDLHQVIKSNDDLTPEHYQFFLYQLLRGLKFIHTGILVIKSLTVADSDIKLK